MGGGKRRWLASERIALRMLEDLGYRVVDTRVRLEVDGAEVGEVDAVAIGPDGERYAVEIKAGRLDVHGVRQAYTNAVVLGAKPLAVCKGFSDEGARALAKRLGVKVIELEDVFLVDAEELEEVVAGAAAAAFAEALRLLADPSIRVKPEQLEVLAALARSESMREAAERLGVTPEELARRLSWLKALSPLARHGFKSMRAAASILVFRARLQALMDNLENRVERLEEFLKRLGA